jgi:hypothetical protein
MSNSLLSLPAVVGEGVRSLDATLFSPSFDRLPQTQQLAAANLQLALHRKCKKKGLTPRWFPTCCTMRQQKTALQDYFLRCKQDWNES